MRTVYNQYDSLVRPLHKWLVERGVVFQLGSCVTDMQLHEQGGSQCVKRIFYECNGEQACAEVGARDYVLVTLGSVVI